MNDAFRSDRYETAHSAVKREVVRESLKSQIDNGFLGVVAARARIAEGKLHTWAMDASSLLTASEFEELAETLGVDLA